MHRHARAIVAGLAVLSVVTLVPQSAGIAAPKGGADRTSPAEAARVDRVKVPDLGWFDCSETFTERARCGIARLPLDYDQPGGATTEVAVLRIPATDRKHRIGSLFLNPGGPGGSGVEFAALAPLFLSEELMARFDIVGVDPRGTNYSDNVKCFKSSGEQSAAFAGFQVPYPVGKAETKAFVKSSETFGRACSTRGKPLSGSMSTAEVARDLDVLRRTFGDKKLTYLGFSYGTYLGAVYANLFPDRVRAVAIDAVLDPVAWVGTPATASIPQTERIRSAEGSWKALRELLTRCGKAGPELCRFAAFGNPKVRYQKLVDDLKRKPLVVVDPDSGEPVTVTYPVLLSFLLGVLYSPDGWQYVDAVLTDVATLQSQASRSTAVKRAKAELAGALRASREARKAAEARSTARADAFGYAFPYDNELEAFQSVLCTDGLNPRKAAGWSKAAARTDAAAPGFGPLWTWLSAPCASSTWTVRDEDAYQGPFTRRSVNPVLVVGSYWDPATNYQGAVAVDRLLGNSRLLSSDNWGHGAYGTSVCAVDAVDRYLLAGTLPARGTVCTGDEQPFVEVTSLRRAAPHRILPPVVPPLPGALPRS